MQPPHLNPDAGRTPEEKGPSLGGSAESKHKVADELGMQAVANRMHVHDLHATILHLMGLDHERLTYRYSGRDFRLTDVSGRVAREILA